MNRRSESTTTKPIEDLFVMIGAQPNTSWLEGVVALDQKGFVITGGPQGFEVRCSVMSQAVDEESRGAVDPAANTALAIFLYTPGNAFLFHILLEFVRTKSQLLRPQRQNIRFQ